ncbi:hypothetical protein, ABC transporter-like protein [Carnobacterium sp. 17-4]|uniref:hypothetical protein n=1 Tax=Carnobacterium sp. (strain 17-4) TaxID=208596 RepID=UPI00020588D2|nr:hypothetical protein [Carnobacterium sp. 17-4]AEB28835.1 hypothetical protein, ABC transporter-like protein [Carnobacterium sp. 17-4]
MLNIILANHIMYFRSNLNILFSDYYFSKKKILYFTLSITCICLFVSLIIGFSLIQILGKESYNRVIEFFLLFYFLYLSSSNIKKSTYRSKKKFYYFLSEEGSKLKKIVWLKFIDDRISWVIVVFFPIFVGLILNLSVVELSQYVYFFVLFFSATFVSIFIRVMFISRFLQGEKIINRNNLLSKIILFFFMNIFFSLLLYYIMDYFYKNSELNFLIVSNIVSFFKPQGTLVISLVMIPITYYISNIYIKKYIFLILKKGYKGNLNKQKKVLYKPYSDVMNFIKKNEIQISRSNGTRIFYYKKLFFFFTFIVTTTIFFKNINIELGVLHSLLTLALIIFISNLFDTFEETHGIDKESQMITIMMYLYRRPYEFLKIKSTEIFLMSLIPSIVLSIVIFIILQDISLLLTYLNISFTTSLVHTCSYIISVIIFPNFRNRIEEGKNIARSFVSSFLIIGYELLLVTQIISLNLFVYVDRINEISAFAISNLSILFVGTIYFVIFFSLIIKIKWEKWING